MGNRNWKRRLQVTSAGLWYIALSIAFGVIALVSANNVIYLLESLLLSGMIFSGILSERAVSAVAAELIRGSASAGEIAQDRIRIGNRRRFSLFCIEIGEWKDGRMVPVAYVPRLAPKQELTLPSAQVLGARGIHRWHGIAIATAYPFGFARKILIIEEPGERVVLPRREEKANADRASAGARPRSRRGSAEFTDGEARPMTPDDDCREIVWTLSARGGEHYVRPRRSDQVDPSVSLDLRQAAGEAFEKQVAAAAAPFYRQAETATGGTLVLIAAGGRRRFHGRAVALKALALADPEGDA